MYNAVGIDASKLKSTITIIQPAGVVIRKPFDVLHTSDELNTLVTYLKSLEGETRAVIECTGRYHEPVVKSLSEAGIFISAVNPKLIKGQKRNTLRKVKSDPADARKIAFQLIIFSIVPVINKRIIRKCSGKLVGMKLYIQIAYFCSGTS